MRSVGLYFKLVDPAAQTPRYAHPGDAGLDLYAVHDVVLEPGTRAAVRTGVAVAIPDGYCGLLLPRSGLAFKYGVTLVNAPGLIDAGYRGELQCIAINHSDRVYEVKTGDKIGQLVISPVPVVTLIQVEDLQETIRGVNGFGSSGR